MDIEKLNPKHRHFAEHYAVNHCASDAAIAAGYSAKTAKQQGYDMLQRADIKAYIEFLEKEALNKLNITRERITQELAKVAFSDITDYVAFDASGVVLRCNATIDKEKLAAISEVSSKPGKEGTSNTIKLHSKLEALKILNSMAGFNAPEKTESSIVVTDTTLDKTEYSIRKRAVDPEEEK